jgi:hypothetical protein
MTVAIATPSTLPSLATTWPDLSTTQDSPGKVVFSRPKQPGNGEESGPHMLAITTGTASISA